MKAIRRVVSSGLAILFFCAGTGCAAPAPGKGPASKTEPSVRRLPVKEYMDKMKGGWIGQFVGVWWGMPMESKFSDIIPEDKVPVYNKEATQKHNLGNDDLFVEMFYVNALEKYGLDLTPAQAGVAFACTTQAIACNDALGRRLLWDGIAPPDSGHPNAYLPPGERKRGGGNAEDICFEIQADCLGLISPGMPNQAIRLGDIFGHITNYGNGVYCGQFMSGMYTEAFFEKDPVKIVRAGLACIPEGSTCSDMIKDLLKWHEENPDDWQKTYKLNQARVLELRKNKISRGSGTSNLAYVVIGILYGKGDLERTMYTAMRGGGDADCTTSSAGGVIAASMGYSNIPENYRVNIDKLLDPILVRFEKLARANVIRAGGRIEKDHKGEEYFLIPVETPKPGPVESAASPGPLANSRFTDEQMREIKAFLGEQLKNEKSFIKMDWERHMEYKKPPAKQ